MANTATLQINQNDIIRQVLSITDVHLLTTIKEFIGSKRRDIEEADAYNPSKAETLAGLDEAFRDARLLKEGKLQGRPVEEFLNEW